MNTTNREIKEKEERLLSFKKEVEGLRNIADAEEYAKQLAHLFLGNGLSLQTILLMAIDYGLEHPNWISVEDELPKERQVVWVRKHFNSENLGEFDIYDSAAFCNGEFQCDNSGNVTHWMPIVPPRCATEKGGVRYVYSRRNL